MRSAALRADASRMTSLKCVRGSVIGETAAPAGGSEPGQVGEFLLAGAHVHASELRAAVQRRHRLPGIEQPVLVERVFYAVKERELGVAELRAHLVHLLDADAVLSGDRTADFDRQG